MPLFEIAISPCPNDTLLFFGWIKGHVGQQIPPNPNYADIERLNEWAFEGRFPLTKLSFAAFKEVQDIYTLLPIGSAIGYGVGPLVISKYPASIDDIPNMRLGIPGKWTTAALLCSHFMPPPAKKRFCRYDEIFSLLKREEIDAGVVIHESRFTYKNENFHLLADLGKMWEERKKCGLPLGGLAIKKEISQALKNQILDTLEHSLAYGKAHIHEALPFILEMASKGASEAIVLKHIDLYVNRETEHLSISSLNAIEELLKL